MLLDQGGQYGETLNWLFTFWSNIHLRSGILFDANGTVGAQFSQPRTGLPFDRQFIIGPDGIIEEAHFFHDPAYTIARIHQLLALTEVADPTTPVPIAPPLAARVVPNPANGGLEIRCQLAAPARVTVTLYDAAGRRARRLATDLALPAGTTPLKWDGRDDHGVPVPSGTYVFHVEGGADNATGKLVLVQ